MPLLNYQLFICFRKFFGFGQFAEFESLRFAQFDLFFHIKHRFATAVADMNMNWVVLVAVKEKPVSVFSKIVGIALIVSISAQESFADVRTNEAGAAGNQKVHGQTLAMIKRAVECGDMSQATREPKRRLHSLSPQRSAGRGPGRGVAFQELSSTLHL